MWYWFQNYPAIILPQRACCHLLETLHPRVWINSSGTDTQKRSTRRAGEGQILNTWFLSNMMYYTYLTAIEMKFCECGSIALWRVIGTEIVLDSCASKSTGRSAYRSVPLSGRCFCYDSAVGSFLHTHLIVFQSRRRNVTGAGTPPRPARLRE